MKWKWLISFFVSIIFFSCRREALNSSIDLTGGWYVDHIEDEARGINYPSLIPADSIIIYFSNDSVYYGRTHRNRFGRTYKYNGDSLLTFQWPLAYNVGEDNLGTIFFSLIRACTNPGCVGIVSPSVISLINGNTLVIRNQTNYKGVFKKI